MGVICISGLPGSGKSSVSTWLAGTVQRAEHVEGNALARRVSAGDARSARVDVGDSGRIDRLHEEERTLIFDRFRYKNSCLLTDSFADAGFEVIVELDIVGDALRA